MKYATIILIRHDTIRCHSKRRQPIQLTRHKSPKSAPDPLLHDRLHCSSFISFPSVRTSLFVFHLISFSPHFIIHVSSHFFQCALYCSCFILFPSVHLIHFINHTPSRSHLLYLVAFIVHRHSTLLSVSLFGQSRLWKLTTYECL